jgi:hypothetical protein
VSAGWQDLLLAYLHDPPDKVLSVRGHVPRARDNAQIAVGDHISRQVLESAVLVADPLASLLASARNKREYEHGFLPQVPSSTDVENYLEKVVEIIRRGSCETAGTSPIGSEAHGTLT